MATARKMERDRRGGRAGARRYQPCDGQPDQRLDRKRARPDGFRFCNNLISFRFPF